MNSNSVHPLARLMGAAVPLVALALIACPEKKEETPPAAVDSGAPAVVPAPTPAPEVDAGPAAAAPEVDAGAAQAPAPTPGKGTTTGTKTGAPTGTTPGTGTATGAKTPETGTATGAKTPETGTAAGAKTPETGSTPGTTGTPTAATGAAAGGATKAVTEPDKKTQRTWKAKCASCHGGDGKGATEQGKKMKVEDMTAAAFQSHVTDAQMHKAIADGYKATVGGVTQEMPAYGSELSPEQIDALVNSVRWLGKK